MDNNLMEAVSWAHNVDENAPSKNTQIQYIKAESKLLKMLSNGILPSASKSRNSRSFMRSALRYCLARRILTNFYSIDRNIKLISKLYSLVKIINADALKAQKDYAAGKVFENTQVRESKRNSVLKGEDWRVDFINFAANSEFIDSIKIMAACGCRPSEIQNGVLVEQNGQTTTFTIKGSKCRKASNKNICTGQELRVLTFNSNHPLMKMISAGTYQANATGICNSMHHFGKKFPGSKKDDPISSYTFRHAAASDFKASGLSAVEISAALGHQSTRTKSKYGYSGKGSVSLNLISVTAKTPVRVITKKSHFKKSKI